MPRIGRRFMPGLHRAAWGFMQSGDFPVPVGHWKFGKNTGAVVYDSSPNGNDGIIEGASWAKGYLGPGLDFDGVDNYVNVPTSASLNPLSEITFGLRVKPSELPTLDLAAMERYYGQNGIHIAPATSGNIWFGSIRTGDGFEKAWSSIKADTEDHHLVVTYDKDAGDDNVKLYLDGVLIATTTNTGDISTSGNWRIGSNTTNGWWKGIVDEVRIYDVTLTAAQIRQWYLGYR